MSADSSTRKSVLRKYYFTLTSALFVMIWYGFFSAWPLPSLRSFFIPGWILILVVSYVLLWRFTCPQCGQHLIYGKLTFGEKELWGTSLLPGSECPSCGLR